MCISVSIVLGRKSLRGHELLWQSHWCSFGGCVEKFEQGRLSKLLGEFHVWECGRWEADASHFPGDGQWSCDKGLLWIRRGIRAVEEPEMSEAAE